MQTLSQYWFTQDTQCTWKPKATRGGWNNNSNSSRDLQPVSTPNLIRWKAVKEHVYISWLADEELGLGNVLSNLWSLYLLCHMCLQWTQEGNMLSLSLFLYHLCSCLCLYLIGLGLIFACFYILHNYICRILMELPYSRILSKKSFGLVQSESRIWNLLAKRVMCILDV